MVRRYFSNLQGGFVHRGLLYAAAWLTLIGMDSQQALVAQTQHASGPVPPRSIARFQMQGSEAISESAGGGTLYKYTDGTGTRVTVFIYPITPGQHSGDVQHVLSGVTAAFIQGLPEGVRRGWYDSYKIADNVAIAVQTPRGAVPGRAVRVAVSADRRPVAELFYIFALTPTLVKVRASVPVHPDQRTQLRPFIEELVAKLAR